MRVAEGVMMVENENNANKMADGTSTGYRKLEKKRSLNMFLRYKLQTVITSWFYHLVGDHIVPLFWVPVLLFCICHPQWCNHIWPIACFGCQHRGCLQGVFFVLPSQKRFRLLYGYMVNDDG